MSLRAVERRRHRLGGSGRCGGGWRCRRQASRRAASCLRNLTQDGGPVEGPAAGAAAGAQGDQRGDIVAVPVHAAALQARLHDHLVGAFDDAAADGQAVRLEGGVLEVREARFQVGERLSAEPLRLDVIARLSDGQGPQGGQHRFRRLVLERVALLAEPGLEGGGVPAQDGAARRRDVFEGMGEVQATHGIPAVGVDDALEPHRAIADGCHRPGGVQPRPMDEQALPVGEVPHLGQAGEGGEVGRVRLGQSLLADALLDPTDDRRLDFRPLPVHERHHGAVPTPLDDRRPLRWRRPLLLHRLTHCRPPVPQPLCLVRHPAYLRSHHNLQRRSLATLVKRSSFARCALLCVTPSVDRWTRRLTARRRSRRLRVALWSRWGRRSGCSGRMARWRC